MTLNEFKPLAAQVLSAYVENGQTVAVFADGEVVVWAAIQDVLDAVMEA